MRRTRFSVIVALAVMLPVGFAVPASALGHGAAHHRATHRPDHDAGLHRGGVAGLSDPRTTHDHQHVQLDGATLSRPETHAPGPAASAPRVPAPQFVDGATASAADPPTAPRANRCTGPPPSLRAPPLS